MKYLPVYNSKSQRPLRKCFDNKHVRVKIVQKQAKTFNPIMHVRTFKIIYLLKGIKNSCDSFERIIHFLIRLNEIIGS